MSDDGGAAFPMPSSPEPRHNETTHYNEGMSLRDWFAGQALAGYRASESDQDVASWKSRDVAAASYEDADAMLAERAKATTPVAALAAINAQAAVELGEGDKP